MLAKILFIAALAAGYVYVSNQDFKDQQMVKKAYASKAATSPEP